MARPQKEGLNYFPLDVDADGDDKMELIEAKHGLIGFAVTIRLLMRIYKNGYYYKWSEKEQLLFARRINVDINTVNDVISDAVKWEMFNKKMLDKQGILTSKGIQKRYLEAVKRRQKVEIIKTYLLLKGNCLNEYSNLDIVDINSIDDNINPQSKVEESKGKESKENEVEPSPAPHQEIIDSYHNNCPSLPRLRMVTDKRKDTIRIRWKKYSDLTTYEELFCKAEGSDFLTGRNGKWTGGCNFDWLMTEANMVKVLEGNYDNRASPGQANVNEALRLVEKYEREGV